MLGRCTACFKWKKSTTYCCIKKGHQGERAAPCSDCFEKGVSISDCQLTHGHCGPGVAATVEKEMTDELPKCIIDLSSVTVSPSQRCATGYLDPYSQELWDTWRKRFSHQSGTDYKVTTGRNGNKESDTGVLTKDGKLFKYRVKWRQTYCCYPGGKPRYKKAVKPLKLCKSRNAPGLPHGPPYNSKTAYQLSVFSLPLLGVIRQKMISEILEQRLHLYT